MIQILQRRTSCLRSCVRGCLRSCLGSCVRSKRKQRNAPAKTAVSGHKGNDLLAIPANNPAASRAAHTADPFTDIFALLYHPADPYRGRHS